MATGIAVSYIESFFPGYYHGIYHHRSNNSLLVTKKIYLLQVSLARLIAYNIIFSQENERVMDSLRLSIVPRELRHYSV